MRLSLYALLLLPSSWTLTLGGDVMLNGLQPRSEPLRGVAAFFRRSDLAIVNLEVPLTSATTRTTLKSAADIRRRAQFVLKADPRHLAALAAAGIDAVSIGNNHALDYGKLGLEETIRLLSRRGIASAGAGPARNSAEAPAMLDSGSGARVALISRLAFRTKGGLGACCPAGTGRPGVAVFDFGGSVDAAARKAIAEAVAAAKSDASLVVAAMHWGIEKKSTPNAYQVALGRALVDAGADIVVGHHPHVLQGAEIYRGKPIFYSLGNLVSARPAATAVVRIVWDRITLNHIEVLPCKIAGGKVTALPMKSRRQALRDFDALCQRVAKGFPDRNAAPPSFTLASVQ